jgi:DNA-binding response OmpR family regulator
MSDEKKTVFIVEDDENISFLLEFMLKREGYKVIIAEDGRIAMEFVEREFPPSMVLLDIMLPHHDGYEIITEIRRKLSWKKVPVIMLTTKAREDDIVRALKAGANDYILKPFQPEELMARLNRFITEL